MNIAKPKILTTYLNKLLKKTYLYAQAISKVYFCYQYTFKKLKSDKLKRINKYIYLFNQNYLMFIILKTFLNY